MTLLSKGTSCPKPWQYLAFRPVPFTCTRPLLKNMMKDVSSNHITFFHTSLYCRCRTLKCACIFVIRSLCTWTLLMELSMLCSFCLRICYLTCMLPGELMTKVVYTPRTFGKATGRLRMIFHTFCTPICSNSRYLAFAHQITPTYPTCKKAQVITVLSNPLSFTKLHKTCK